MAYARITLNNSSPLLMFRHRVTAPHPLANSFRLVGKYWHRYFQSVFTMFLFMRKAYISHRNCQFLILAPMR